MENESIVYSYYFDNLLFNQTVENDNFIATTVSVYNVLTYKKLKQCENLDGYINAERDCNKIDIDELISISENSIVLFGFIEEKNINLDDYERFYVYFYDKIKDNNVYSLNKKIALIKKETLNNCKTLFVKK